MNQESYFGMGLFVGLIAFSKYMTQPSKIKSLNDIPDKSLFLNQNLALRIRNTCGTPAFVYDEKLLIKYAQDTLSFPHSFGLTVRFAMKASPNASILRLFDSLGLCFDASSGYEVFRAVACGISAKKISLSSQEFPNNFYDIYSMGVAFNACSLSQLERFGEMFPGHECGIRFNPGQGSGGTTKTNVGGPSASFGIWHEFIGTVKDIVSRYQLRVVRIHTHIGSGSDPAVWQRVAALSLALVEEFEDVVTLNLGGGFKVGRMSYEKSTDLQAVGHPVRNLIESFHHKTGRKLHLEIEPGTYLVARAGALLSTVQDVVTTGTSGFKFVKLDCGMSEILRPSLYGASHPVVVLKDSSQKDCENVIVVGHCCESGDLLSCAPGDSEVLLPRCVLSPSLNDLVSVESCGAYCASMCAKNYNSFPEAPEVMIDSKGVVHLIRSRQSLEQIFQNEVPIQKL